MKNNTISKRKAAVIYVAVTLLLTWLLQFMPMILKMDVSGTSVSSFDASSVFFTIGGMLPSLLGVIFVFVLYDKIHIKDYLRRCFVPGKRCWTAILISLALICFESFVTQTVSRCMGAEHLGFEGLKLIAANPLMFFYFLFWGLISGPFSEEFGWRGFLTDMLFDKKKITQMSIQVGLVWGLWHLPLFFYPAQIQYDWVRISPLLGIGFVVNCITNALVYNVIYIISGRKVFPIFFLHMFENIILTGAMIYPFSSIYSIVVIPVSIIIDLVFYVVMTRTGLYKSALDEC